MSQLTFYSDSSILGSCRRRKVHPLKINWQAALSIIQPVSFSICIFQTLLTVCLSHTPESLQWLKCQSRTILYALSHIRVKLNESLVYWKSEQKQLGFRLEDALSACILRVQYSKFHISNLLKQTPPSAFQPLLQVFFFHTVKKKITYNY